MKVDIVATIDGRHYVAARDVERVLFGSKWSMGMELDYGIVRGRRYRLHGHKRERNLLDLEDAKIMADLCEALSPYIGHKGQDKLDFLRKQVLDYFAVRASWPDWETAWHHWKDAGYPRAL